MTEKWRPIPSLPGYEASSEGRIRNGARILNGTVDRYGYRYFNIKGGKKVKAHRLVCEAFHGPPAAEQCAHADGDKLNNRPGNLRWASRSDNAQDSIRHGTFRRPLNPMPPNRTTPPGKGKRYGAKLSLEQIAEIRRRCEAGEFQYLVAEAFGVNQSTICRIANFQRGGPRIEPASLSRPYGLQSTFAKGETK